MADLTRSDWAAKNGIKITVPVGGAIHRNLKSLAQSVLQPLDDHLQKEKRKVIFVTSGFRPKAVNKAVGGAENSLHTTGQAADIVVSGSTPMWVCKTIVGLNLPFDELILEFDHWTHVAVAANPMRPVRKILTAKKRGGKTVYLPGLVS